MRLSGVKTSVKGYIHYLGSQNLPPRIDEKQIPSILSEIRLQNQSAIDKAIMGHARLAMEIVGRYLHALGSDRWADDLVGAAMLGLVQSVNWISIGRMPHDNLTAYIVDTIHRFISDCIDHSQIVRVPEVTRRQRAKRLGKDNLARPKTLSIHNVIKFESLPTLKKRSLFQVEQEPYHSSPVETIALREIVNKTPTTPLQKRILQLREEGHKDAEIAEILEISTTSVWLMRQEMHQRFIDMIGELE